MIENVYKKNELRANMPLEFFKLYYKFKRLGVSKCKDVVHEYSKEYDIYFGIVILKI